MLMEFKEPNNSIPQKINISMVWSQIWGMVTIRVKDGERVRECILRHNGFVRINL